MTTTYIILTIAVASVGTFIMRLIPFAVFGRREEPPKVITYIGSVLPAAIMTILIVFCLKGVTFTSLNSVLPPFIGIAIVIALHLWKRNNLISIGVGTVCYMIMVQYIFV